MKPILKWLGIVLGAVIVLILVAIGIFAATFDPNAYRDEIAELVKKETGRDLQIPGEISLTFFPWLGARVGEISLGNAPGFPAQPFARVSSASVRVKLLPLFSGNVEIAKIVIEGLEVELVRKKDGKTNWDDLTGAGKTEAAPAPQPEQEPGGAAIGALAIAGVELRDAKVAWIDHSADQRVSINNLMLEIGAFAPGSEVPISSQFNFANQSPAVDGKLSLSTHVVVDLNAGLYTLKKTQLDTAVRGEVIPGEKLDAGVKIPEIVFNGTADTLTVKDVAVRALDLEVVTGIDGKKLSTAPQFSGELSLKRFNPRALLAQLNIDMPQTTDDSVLKSAELSAKFNATTESAALSDIVVVLDDTTAKGQASIRQFSAPAYGFKLDIDKINADRYLPPPAEGQEAEPVATPGAAALGIPVEPLRGLNLDGTMTVGQLTVMKLQMQKVVVTTAAKAGVLRVHPFTAKLYQGDYAGDIRLDVRGKKPKYSADESINNVQVGPLLKDMFGEEYLTGKVNLNAALTSAGDTVPQIKKQLDGAIKFAFDDGYVNGIDVIRDIRVGYAELVGQTVKPADKERRTYFSSITGSANIQNGVVKNDDLYAKAPLLRVKGRGQFDLVKEAVDYRATVRLTDNAKGQLGKEYDQLIGVDIPLRVKGGLDKLSYDLDWDAVAKSRAKAEVDKEVDKQTEKLKEQLGDQLDDSVKDKLGKDLLKGLKF